MFSSPIWTTTSVVSLLLLITTLVLEILEANYYQMF